MAEETIILWAHKLLTFGTLVDGPRLANMALKPALGEVSKKHPVRTKVHLFEIQNRQPLPDPSHRP